MILNIGTAHNKFSCDVRGIFTCSTNTGYKVKIYHSPYNIVAWVSMDPQNLPNSDVHRFIFPINSWPILKLTNSVMILYDEFGKKTEEDIKHYDDTTVQDIRKIIIDATALLGIVELDL